MKFLLLGLLALVIVVPAAVFHLGEKKKKRFKTALGVNLALFFTVLAFATVYVFTGSAQAAGQVAAAAPAGNAAGMAYIAAAAVMSVATVATGIAVSTSASAALGALSENDKIFGKAIIFVAMAEGIALYGLLVAFMILGKV
ncbi:MAG: ATP synthase subunit C [Firmicutes bacterium]|nr:ATP synthase subunit C [Bacillota bacterium]